MAIILGQGDLANIIDSRKSVDLLAEAYARPERGDSYVSPKYVSEFKGGFVRVLVASDPSSGHFVTKVYHMADGDRPRFVVSLYSHSDGALLAVMDGRLITDLRTGAATGVAARHVPLDGPVSVGIVGSGNQAKSQLVTLASVYSIADAAVFSPTPRNREAFAEELGRQLGFEITPCGSAEEAVRGRGVVATASSARDPDPVVRADWLADCRLLCAVGNTRPKFCEVDVDCFARASLVIVDTPHALEEAGELLKAKAEGALDPGKVATLSQVVGGRADVPGEGLIVFKSVGSALQDLALAKHYYEALRDADVPNVDDLAY